jgi:hypothetical protein
MVMAGDVQNTCTQLCIREIIHRGKSDDPFQHILSKACLVNFQCVTMRQLLTFETWAPCYVFPQWRENSSRKSEPKFLSDSNPILLSSSKNSKKTLDFYSFVTSF